MNHEAARNMGKGLRRCQSVGAEGRGGRLVASSHIAHSGSVRANAEAVTVLCWYLPASASCQEVGWDLKVRRNLLAPLAFRARVDRDRPPDKVIFFSDWETSLYIQPPLPRPYF